MLYASATWTLLDDDLRRLEAFHMRSKRCILGVKWYNFVTNGEIYARSQLKTIKDLIRSRRTALLGHVSRLAPEVPAHKILKYSIALKSNKKTFSKKIFILPNSGS